MATDQDAQDWIDAVIQDGGTVNEFAIDEFVQNLKGYGIWSKLDFFHLFHKAGSVEAAKKCLIRLSDGSIIGATFDDDEGLPGDGTDDYFRPYFSPSTDGVNFQQDSAHFLLGIKEGHPIADTEQMGNVRTAISAFASGNIKFQINTGSNDSAGSGPADGIIIANRFNSTEHQIARNGSILATESEASQSLVDWEMLGLARNTNTGGDVTANDFSDVTLRFMGGGAGLTSQEISDFNDALNQYYVDVDNAPSGTTISGITQKDGVALVADGTYVQHLYADDNKGTNETPLEVGQTTSGEVTFSEELPAGKVRFIRIAYQDAGRDVVKEQFFTD